MVYTQHSTQSFRWVYAIIRMYILKRLQPHQNRITHSVAVHQSLSCDRFGCFDFIPNISLECKHIRNVRKRWDKTCYVFMFLIPFDIISQALTSHYIREKCMRVGNRIQIEALYVTRKSNNRHEQDEEEEEEESGMCWFNMKISCRYIAFICVFKLIIRHWSNVRKWGERGAKTSIQ